LFLSAFLSATLLPGHSELVLMAVVLNDPGALWLALAVATVGNTLGGLSSYWIGRLLPARQQPSRELRWLQRWGSPALLLSWVPVIGDGLCVAAGWLRLSVGWAAVYLAAGKFLRYWVLANALIILLDYQ
jgi:membrane protein YqaA with SNARE-associated domain